MGAQRKVNSVAVVVYSPVEKLPSASSFQLATCGDETLAAVLTKACLPVRGRMIKTDIALGDHFINVTQVQRINDILAYA
jgi:hypothetical protein